jgi:hypothetical protein
MGNVSKKAILRAYINSILTDLMVKTTGEQVYIDETTTLATKLTEIVTAINLRAKTSDVTAQINALKQELLGDVPVEAYNTFTELAQYIADHEDVAEALTSAIGNKAEQSEVAAIQTVINALGTLSKKNTVSEADLDSSLKSKINAASEGNHAHDNKSALDKITDAKITAWDGKSTVYFGASQPPDMTEQDLLIQIID